MEFKEILEKALAESKQREKELYDLLEHVKLHGAVGFTENDLLKGIEREKNFIKTIEEDLRIIG